MTMPIKIENKIVGYEVVKPEKADAQQPKTPEVQLMDENVQRPEVLIGETYKIKTPLSEHALYVTINDMVLNPGTEHETRRPFEIFINSKNMDHFQWIVALTRIVSAVFRKGGDCTFLAEELRSVFDPKGGYFKKGGRFMPSLVAEIGDVIEMHLRKIGLLDEQQLDEHQRAFIEQKKAEFQRQMDPGTPANEDKKPAVGKSQYPDGAQLCDKCNTKAMIQMDGCMTCLNCGDSKCG
jgi:hypothetical protein